MSGDFSAGFDISLFNGLSMENMAQVNCTLVLRGSGGNLDHFSLSAIEALSVGSFSVSNSTFLAPDGRINLFDSHESCQSSCSMRIACMVSIFGWL